MVKLTLNLRNKNLFFLLSFLGLLLMLYQIGHITSLIDIKALDIVNLFICMGFTAAMFWIPFEFNDKFI